MPLNVSHLKKQTGGIAIILLLGMATIGLAIVSSTVILSLGELKMSQGGGAFEQTFYAAEAGLNEGLYRLKNYGLGEYNFNLNGTSVAVKIKPDPANHYQRIIESEALDPLGKIRKLTIKIKVDSFATGFDYAVQGGTAGIYLDNNSKIIGDVYANGNVLPASDGAKGNIEGDVWVAENNKVDKMTISGNAYAKTINNSAIIGEAYYQVIDDETLVKGSKCPNLYCHNLSILPAVQEFPIDETDVIKWQEGIAIIGNPILLPNPDKCPTSKKPDYYCVTEDITLGNQKIAGNLYVGSGATLNLIGNIWVTGKIVLDNNGLIKIDQSVGPSGVAIIADQTVDINNNYLMQGSGTDGSFILLVSLSNSLDPSAPAVYAANNSASLIFAALKGMLKVKNGGILNVALAEQLWLEPHSQVIYNPLLSIFTLSTGETGGPVIVEDSWQEL